MTTPNQRPADRAQSKKAGPHASARGAGPAAARGMQAAALVDTAQSRLTARGIRRRDELLEATFRIIVRDGPGAVTLRAVVAEAKASHGAVKYYFDSRAELIKESLRTVARHNVEALARTWDAIGDDIDDPARLASIIARHSTREMVEDRRMGLLIHELHLASARDPELRPVIRAWGRAYAKIVHATLAALGSTQPAADAALLTSVISGLVIGQLALPRDDFEHEVLRPALERILRGIQVSATAARCKRGAARGAALGAPRGATR